MLNNDQSLVLDDFTGQSKKYHKAFLKYMEPESSLSYENDLKKTFLVCYLIETEINIQLNVYLSFSKREKERWLGVPLKEKKKKTAKVGGRNPALKKQNCSA